MDGPLGGDARSDQVIRLVLSEVAACTEQEAVAYMCGAMHDGTRSALHRTIRISQSSKGWLCVLERVLAKSGSRCWSYREGSREMWVVEAVDRLPTLGHLKDPTEQVAYVRGYFDAEGGFPRSPAARSYVQFAQKNFDDLAEVKSYLQGLGIRCGSIHNPSVRVDPNYWRFYVAAASQRDFLQLVRPWHPRKRGSMQIRFALRP